MADSPDRFLHHDDGTHRSTAPTANGRDLERFERELPAHLADGHRHCRHCHHPIFQRPSVDGDTFWGDDDGQVWDLVYREQDNTLICWARSEHGTWPHEPQEA
jgi:hypothetical protein